MNDKAQPKVTWDAESTHPELIEPFKEAMQEINDPEIGLNIIELGLVRNLRIDQDQAFLTMILTTPFCPYGPALLETARQKAESALKVPVTIEFGMEMWDFSMMDEGAARDWGFY
jgi:metal-sulfur cluster biosynthetic enzyme